MKNHIKTKLINWLHMDLSNPEKKNNNFNDNWTKVLINGKWIPADEIMRQHGFNPEKKARIGDSINSVNAPNVNINQINSLALDNVFLGWGELSLLQQNCLVQNICGIYAHFMTEKWVEFHSKDESKRDKIVKLEQANTRLSVKKLMTEACYKTVLLGTGYVSPKLKNDDDDLANPLILDSSKIGKGDLEYIQIIEPTWIVPIDFNMSKPRLRNFYKPEAYILFGERLHYSRLHQLKFISPVNLISPIYLFGGIPLIQLLLTGILNFTNTNKEIVQFISRYNLNLLGTNMNQLANENNPLVKARMAVFEQARNNWGTLLYDKQTEEFTQMQLNVSGLTDVLQQQGEFLSLLSRIPVTYLFGQTPRGLNATGQLDAQMFNENILALQEAKLRPTLEWLFNIIQLSEFGEIDDDISFTFVPLGSMDEKTQAEINLIKQQVYTGFVQNAMADPQAMMDVVTQDETMGLSNYEHPEITVEPDFDDE